MQKLELLLKRYAQHPHRVARWWIGERPTATEDVVWREIAGRVGYPTSSPDYFAGGLKPLSSRQAAHVLAVAGTTSLPYENRAPSAAEVDHAAQALNELGARFMFLSNGSWEPEQAMWTPLTTATFDCGLIGYDDEKAFIFWVEEED